MKETDVAQRLVVVERQWTRTGRLALLAGFGVLIGMFAYALWPAWWFAAVPVACIAFVELLALIEFARCPPKVEFRVDCLSVPAAMPFANVVVPRGSLGAVELRELLGGSRKVMSLTVEKGATMVWQFAGWKYVREVRQPMTVLVPDGFRMDLAELLSMMKHWKANEHWRADDVVFQETD